MKTLIAYATKHGAALEIARQIAGKTDGSVLYDLKQGGLLSIDEFDCIIVGSSVYAGMIRKEAKAFLSQNADLLRSKRLGLFYSGMDPSREKDTLEANFPADILQAAKSARFLGGIFDPEKAGFLERLIMKAASKQTGYANNIDAVKIELFIEELWA